MQGAVSVFVSLSFRGRYTGWAYGHNRHLTWSLFPHHVPLTAPEVSYSYPNTTVITKRSRFQSPELLDNVLKKEVLHQDTVCGQVCRSPGFLLYRNDRSASNVTHNAILLPDRGASLLKRAMRRHFSPALQLSSFVSTFFFFCGSVFGANSESWSLTFQFIFSPIMVHP